MASRKPERTAKTKSLPALAKKGKTAMPAKKAPVKKAPAKKAPAKKATPFQAVGEKAAPPFKRQAPASISRARAQRASASTPARDARSALAQKRAIKATLEPVSGGKEVVDAYFRDVDHPFKAEMEAVRRIILGASPKISERIKWNAPSFYYKEDLGAFNPRATEFAHLILLFPGGEGMQAKDALLEGEHKDRREVKFHGMDDVTVKKPALEKLVKRWVALRER